MLNMLWIHQFFLVSLINCAQQEEILDKTNVESSIITGEASNEPQGNIYSNHRTPITNDDQIFTNLRDTHADGINKIQTNNVPNLNDGGLYENTSHPGLGQPVALGHIPMSQDMYETHSIEDEFSDELYEDEYDKVYSDDSDESDIESPVGVEDFSQKDLNRVVEGIADMAIKITSQVEHMTKKNFVWSPFSAHSALSQLLLGSSGSTRKQLQQLLGIKRKNTRSYPELQHNMVTSDAIQIANLVAVSKQFKPKPSYLKRLKRFNSKTIKVDERKAKGAVSMINRFISQHTNGKISNLASEDDIDEEMTLILLNAIYFKGAWKNKFDAESTVKNDFFASSGTFKTDFMVNKMQVRMVSSEDCDVLELPYAEEELSMIVLLPKKKDRTKDIMKLVEKVDFTKIRSEPLLPTLVSLPKFSIDYMLDLKKVMRAMGLKRAFSQRANFRRISSKRFPVSDVLQTALVEVNENGTEAVAVSSIKVFNQRIAVQEKRFEANHPFIFLVHDFRSNIPIFIGKFQKPCEK